MNNRVTVNEKIPRNKKSGGSHVRVRFDLLINATDEGSNVGTFVSYYLHTVHKR